MTPCPRCARENPATAPVCAGCGTPLAFGDDPPPVPLGLELDLDRRRRGSGLDDDVPEPEPELDRQEPAGPAPPPAFEPDRSDWRIGAAPQPSAPGQEEAGPQPASRARRAAAWAIDAALLAVVAGAVPSVLFASTAVPPVTGADPLGSDLMAALALSEAFVGVVAFVYATASHALGGATLGKRLAGIRVVGPDGRPPGFAMSAQRSAFAVLSFALGGLGFLPALLAPSRRALHDLLAGTRVVEGP